VIADDPYATFADQSAVSRLAQQLVYGPGAP